ncbi:MAG: hypothetical protein ACJAWZ_000968 [Paracoccaceae bacterium]
MATFLRGGGAAAFSSGEPHFSVKIEPLTKDGNGDMAAHHNLLWVLPQRRVCRINGGHPASGRIKFLPPRLNLRGAGTHAARIQQRPWQDRALDLAEGSAFLRANLSNQIARGELRPR